MGFLSTLGNFAGGLFGDPGLGDQIGGLFGGGDTAGAVGQTAAQIAAGRAKGRIDQAKLQQEQDALAQARAKLALSAPGQEAGNAVRGDILANGKDATVSGLPSYIHVGQVSGGLRPSMLSSSSRALGANMSRNALANNMNGSDVPNLTPLPASTGLDTGLNAVAGGAGFLNALKGAGGGATSGGSDPNGPGFVQGQDYGGGENIPSGDAGADPNGIDPSLLEWFKQQSNPTGLLPGGPD